MVLFLLALTMMLTVSSSSAQGTKSSLRGKVSFGNDLEKTLSATNTTSRSSSHYRFNTTNKSAQAVRTQRFLSQNAFQRCNTDKLGTSPTEWTPECRNDDKTAFSGLDELMKLLPILTQLNVWTYELKNLHSVQLSGDDIDSDDSMGVDVTLNTDGPRIFFGMPLGIDALGFLEVNCNAYMDLHCEVLFNNNVAKFFTVVDEGGIYLVKEADKSFQNVGNTLAVTFQDNVKLSNIFSEDIFKNPAKILMNGSIIEVNVDFQAIAAFMESTFLPEAVMDNLTNMVKMVGNVGKKLIDYAEKNYKQADENFQTAYKTVVDSFNEYEARWLEKKLEGTTEDDVHSVALIFCCNVIGGLSRKCDSTPLTTYNGKQWHVLSCVNHHGVEIQNVRQAKITRNNVLEYKSSAFVDNKKSIAASSYSNSAIRCTNTWVKSRKVGSMVPFSFSCTVDTILKTGQTGSRTVTREKLINVSNSHIKTSAMAELISNTKDTLIAKITETMNGGFLGCFYDNDNDMSMPTDVGQFHQDPTRCVLECNNRGFDYAATKTGWQCRCANKNVKYWRHGRGIDCQCDISGNGGGKHNGNSRQCVYQVKGKTKIDTAPAKIGCFKDTSDRALPKRRDSGTLNQCVANCSGFSYIGRQYTGECWCGNEGYDKHGTTEDCDCEGSNVGNYKMCVWTKDKRTDEEIEIDTTPAYLGCFKDTRDRALSKRMDSGTVDQCVQNCSGFSYIGRQYTGQCWCGNEGYDKHGTTEDCDCEGSNVGPYKMCVWAKR